MKKVFIFFISAVIFTSCSGYFPNSNNGAQNRESGDMHLALADGSGYLSTDQYNEITPFVFRDKANNKTYLFYASDKDGSYDIYYAEMNSEGKFYTPVKFGSPVNTSSNEISPVIIQTNGTNYLTYIQYNSSGTNVTGYKLDLNFQTNSSISIGTPPSMPLNLSSYPGSDGNYHLLIVNGSGTIYKYYLFLGVGAYTWIQENTTNLSTQHYSLCGYETAAGPFTNIYALYDTMTGGRHQINGEVFIQGSGTYLVPFDISSYSSSSDDAYPFIDTGDGYKVYFASKRYGKGNYDLYRFNTKTFDAQIPAYLKNFNAVYVSPAGNDANAGIVPASPLKSLLNAISSADIWGIHNIFVAAGVYTPATGLNTMFFTSKSNVNMIGGYNNNFTSIVGRTELDMQGTTSPFLVMNSSLNMTINNFVFRNFLFAGGGAIEIDGCTGIVFINDIVTNNGTNMGNGGGFYIYGSSYISINGCTIANNLASYGGGIYLAYSSYNVIANSTIMNNYVDTNNYGYGGGIYYQNCDYNNIINCNISGNISYSGGGLYYVNCVSNTISGCTINTNSAVYNGGGVYLGNNSNTSILGCTINTNTANNEGGGLWIYQENFENLLNCDIFYNAASAGGGIMFLNTSVVTNNCIIKLNTPDNVSNYFN